MLPGLTTLPPAYQLAFWALSGCLALVFGLAVYLLKRYIDSKDKLDEGVLKKLTDHDSKALEHTEKITKLAGEMKSTSLDFHKTVVEHQGKMNTELLAVRKDVQDIRGFVVETKATAQAVSEKLTSTKGQLDTLYDTVEGHSKQLKTGAETIRNNTDLLKTLIVKLGPNATLITSEKKDSGG